MSKKKSTYPVLLAGLGLVAAAVWGLQHFNERRQAPEAAQTLLDAHAGSQADSFTLTKGGQTLAFAVQNGIWNVGPDKFPADGQKIVRFFDQLSQIRLDKTVSATKEQWHEFGFDKPTEVKIMKGPAPLLTMTIGKNRVGGGVYFRKNTDDTIFLSLHDVFIDMEAPNWEYKRIMHIGANDLKDVTFSDTHHHQLKFVKSGTDFKLEGSAAKGTGDINSKDVGATLENLVFDKRVPWQGFDFKAHPSLAKTEVNLDDGRHYTIEVFAKTGDQPEYFLKIAGTTGQEGKGKDEVASLNQMSEKWAWRVATWVADRFTRALPKTVADKGKKKK